MTVGAPSNKSVYPFLCKAKQKYPVLKSVKNNNRSSEMFPWMRRWEFKWWNEILLRKFIPHTLKLCCTHPTKHKLQRWSYWREHLKYVWNVYCDATNHRRDHHTTETTSNERFPICHGTNYFHFALTFSLFTSKQLLFLPFCLQYLL